MAKLEQTLGTDLASIAKLLRSKGRGKDTILAHITPKEAALLKRRGGSGSTNPNTGLPEFDDSVDSASVDQAPIEQAPPPVDQAPTYVPTEGPYKSDNQGLDPIPTQSSFDPFSYSGGFGGGGGQPYQGDPSQPTPTYASPSAGTAAFGADGGASINPNLPGAATALEPVTPSVDTGDKTPVKPGGGKDPFAMPSLGDLGKLGLAGALGAYGASQARRGSAQTQAATAQQQQIAAPYQQQGQQLISQAQAGQLTPSSQQALEAAKAQLAQSQSNRGGVGAQQSANQIANIYQTLLDNQYKYGLQVMQIGDNISLGAIKSGLQLDQQLQTSTNNFYSQLASIVGGQPIRVA